jgi:LAO/AO transport system kinase
MVALSPARDTSTLLERLTKRDRRALARLISLAETGEAPSPPAPTTPAHVVGITGSGGAGKSTLVGALIGYLRKQLGLRVAVLACDPQSPKTGGALLGDRIRVRFDPADEDVFFRSMSTRGAPGGVSEGAGRAIAWMQAFGYDVILVETVGVGQDQVAVRNIVDTLILLVTPAAGDEIQWEKAGVIELADLVVVNKSDMPGAEHVREQLRHALSLSPAGHDVPVLAVTATTATGVPELWKAVAEMGGTESRAEP